MYSHPGRGLIASAERRFGRFAIPHLIRWVGMFQLAIWGLELFVSSGGDGSSMLGYLVLDSSSVLSGQVWRLATFVLIPGTSNPLLILFMVFFLWFISDGLEQEWGPFRINLYVFATVGCLIMLGMIPGIGIYVNVGTNFVFFTVMFLAFAAIYPNQIINLFGIIPIKAKWLAIADVVLLLSMILSAPVMVLPIGVAFLPFLVVFLPGFMQDFRDQSAAATRRTAFQSEVQDGEGNAFHTCEGCGKTDVSDPELEFRVTAEGGEFCVDCLPSQKAEPEPGES